MMRLRKVDASKRIGTAYPRGDSRWTAAQRLG